MTKGLGRSAINRTQESEPLIHVGVCVACPGLEALARAGLVDKPVRFGGPARRGRPKRQKGKPRVSTTVGKKMSRAPGEPAKEGAA
jgi:hypothetical protein